MEPVKQAEHACVEQSLIREMMIRLRLGTLGKHIEVSQERWVALQTEMGDRAETQTYDRDGTSVPAIMVHGPMGRVAITAAPEAAQKAD